MHAIAMDVGDAEENPYLLCSDKLQELRVRHSPFALTTNAQPPARPELLCTMTPTRDRDGRA